MLNKLTSPFHTHKKRRHTDRRSSLSTFIDYFRTEDPHPFANDALFEHNRYKQQKSLSNHINNNSSCILSSQTTKETFKKPMIHHRHTNSTPIQTGRKKSQQHIRHYSHVSCISSSNITVNSEDLTAKEFADIAGIRILSEEETEGCKQKCKSEKICTFCGQEDNERLPSLIVTSRISQNSMIRGSDHSSIYCPPDSIHLSPEEEEEHQIWDNQFWKKPGGETILMPPILHELKHHQDTFIKKGRFEIHLSSTINVPPPQQPVYEWKRKSRPVA